MTSRFGPPLNSDGDSYERGPLPPDSAICQDLYEHGLATCSEYKSSRAVEKSRFIGKDRVTPIDLTIRTLRYSALLVGDRLGMTKIRERMVGILTVSSPAGATPLKPVVTGFFFRYLN